MIENLRLDWLLFQMHGLFPKQAETLAWGLPIALMLLGLLLFGVWILRLQHDDWIGTAAGYAAIVAGAFAFEALLFRPITAWLLLGQHRPDFFWVLRTYTKECVALAVGFPFLHWFALYAYPEIGAWFTHRRV